MERYTHTDLCGFAARLLEEAGLSPDRAGAAAEILVEGDLLGHTTHGLQLLAPYLREIEAGTMTTVGDPETINDRGAVVTWDGRRLPGPWLICRAIDLAVERAPQYGNATVVIRRSHHIACLAAYLRRATDRGYIILLMTSDPAGRGVAPAGSVESIYTPNPIAAGWPTDGDPVLIDISMSTTTNGLTNRSHAEGRPLPHPWLIDGHGRPSADPGCYLADPPGAIMPLGGLDLGHKGFALGLLVETLTSALGGFGRADQPQGWYASVFLQVIDPSAFGGADAFVRETEWMADAARAARPIPGGPPVRLPGAAGQARRAAQLHDGITLHPGILDALAPWARRFGIAMPEAKTG
jgi:LDH2 family malate/lactate/ureidoglycolate dehydrogenase